MNLRLLPLLFSGALVANSTDLDRSNVLTPERVAEIQNVASCAMSPDGKTIAYTLSVPRKPGVDEDGGAWTELWLTERENGTPHAFVRGKSELSSVEWTPDGQSVAFLAKRGDDKNTALYLISKDGGEARRVASLKTAISSYSFAPDGKRAALLAPRPVSDAHKRDQDKGFKEEVYEEDWSPTQVWIANLSEAGEPTNVKALALEGSACAVRWSPVAGDERLAVSLAPTSLVDDEYMNQRVRIVDAASGKLLAKIENPGKLGAFRWSPDGKWIGLLSAADIHDPFPSRLCIVPASGGAPVELMPGLEADVLAFEWQGSKDGVDSILCCIDQGVWNSFEKLGAIENGVIKTNAARKTLVPTGGPILTAMSLSKDGQNAAFVANSPAHPPELYRMSHGEAGPTRVTNSNPWIDALKLSKQEVVKHKARDGAELEGVLVHPLNEQAGQRYPLILCVHGGPEAHEVNGWATNYSRPGQMAAAEDIAVFYPNYRGSTGRGVAFSKLSQGDAGGKEFDDLVDAVDHLVEMGLVDTRKVGITGGSYGGYATAWCSTRYSERFAAGVMFVGISDKIAKVGTTDIPNEEFYVHALHRVWDDWEFFLKRSPIYYAAQCKTPLLIMHGKDDPRVNPGQSRELYRQLKIRGQAPVRLVLYPGEGHGNRKACARLDYSLRMMQWFETYLLGSGGELPKWEIDHGGTATANSSSSSAAAPASGQR